MFDFEHFFLSNISTSNDKIQLRDVSIENSHNLMDRLVLEFLAIPFQTAQRAHGVRGWYSDGEGILYSGTSLYRHLSLSSKLSGKMRFAGIFQVIYLINLKMVSSKLSGKLRFPVFSNTGKVKLHCTIICQEANSVTTAQ